MYCSPSSPSPLQSSHPLQYSSAFSSPVSHPLLKLMSLSATLPPPSSSSTSSSSASSSSLSFETTMLLKSGSGHAGSPVPVPSPSNGNNPESPKSSAANHTSSPSSSSSSYNHNNNNKEDDEEESRHGKDDDGDEVLSIGGKDDEVDTITTTTTTTMDEVTVVEEMMEEDEEDGHPDKIIMDEEDDVDDDTFSQKSHISQSSSLPPSSSSSSSSSKTSRVRKYSSEDCFSIKSLCSPASSLNHPVNGGGIHSPQEDVLRRSSSSLLFSIANILRPDFGSSPSPFVPQKKSITSPPRPPHHHYELYKPYGFLGGGHPIDLSRSQQHQQSQQSPYPQILDKISSKSTGVKNQHHHKSKKSSHGNSGGDRDRIKTMGQQLHSLKNNNNNNNNSVKSANLGTNNSGTNGSNNNNSNNSSSKSVTSLPNPKGSKGSDPTGNNGQTLWPAWVYCTRYSDRPSSERRDVSVVGPRARRERKSKEKEVDEKRPRTAFTAEQLARLKKEFDENRYLTEKRRQDLARELRLHENQIKIWFQNKRAKLKKASGTRGGLALQLMAQGLYNHSTIPKSGDEDDSDE